MIGTAPVQAEIYRILVDAAIVPAARVVDGPVTDPKLIEFPYLQLGDTQTIDDDVVGRAGSDEFLSLHIWSRKRGQTEIKTLAGQLADLFRGRRLVIAGYGSVDVFVRDLRVFMDPDNLTMHGVLTVHIHAFGESEN